MPRTLTLGSGVRTKSAWLIAVPFFVLAGPTPVRLVIGVAISALGLGLRGWSAGTIHKNEALTTSGPYAFVRNPLYVGSFLIGGGLSVAGGSWLWLVLFLVFYAALYGPTVAAEAERLTEQFGHLYVEYSAQVPAFIPRLTPFRSVVADSADGFQWSQYERNREWEALLGAGAAFALLWLKMAWLG